ncbi:MAG: cysteine desulfurase [Bdellovibrionia bacterium]
MNSEWLTRIRADFPILPRQVRGKPLVYLDNAATTLKPKAVVDKLSQHYLMETSNIHRGVYFLSEQATEAYENVREKVRDFINAPDLKEIIFTRGTTEAVNLVASSFGQKFLHQGDEIIISEMEHHSNIVPWQMLCEKNGCVLRVIPMNDNGDIIMSEYEKLLNAKTKLVSVVYVSNSLGTVNPVRKIIELAKARKIPVMLDAAQAIATRPVDVQELGCDFLAFSSHKMFGPTGVGVLWGKAEWLDKMPPYQGGGDMIASVTFEKTQYNVLPYKFEAGTPPIAGVIGFGEAIDYIRNIGFDKIRAHEDELLSYATATLSKIPGLKIIGTAAEKAAIVSFTLEGIHPHDIGTLLDQEGVAVRTGHHCTQPVMKHFKVPATARASFSIYNTRDEIDRLAAGIVKVMEVFK